MGKPVEKALQKTALRNLKSIDFFSGIADMFL